MLEMLVFLLPSLLHAACNVIFTSPELRGQFRMTTEEFGEKPMFFDGENYLFFKIIDGKPKWIIADQTEGGTVIGEIESWAHHPVDIQKVSPFSKWYLDDYGDKVEVEAKWVKSECSDYDHTIHISSSKNAIVDGFYHYRMNRLNDHATFRNGRLYLYYIASHQRYVRWMISHDYGSDAGVAYVDNAKDLPHNTEGSWQITTPGGWQHDHALKMTRSMFTRSSWRSLMFRRQKNYNQLGTETTFNLRNEMKLPKVLVDAKKATSAFNIKVAHKNKYRLFLVSPKQLSWTNEVGAQGRQMVSALRIAEKKPESILSVIESSRKQRGYLECVVLDTSPMSAAEIIPAWSVLEKAYADGKCLCVGSVGGNLEHNKLLATQSLPPHFMILGELNSDFNELTEALEDKDIQLYLDNGLKGNYIDATKRTELTQIAKSKRASVEVVNAAWSISQGYGTSHVLNPSANLPDAGRIFNLNFDNSFKDEL